MYIAEERQPSARPATVEVHIFIILHRLHDAHAILSPPWIVDITRTYVSKLLFNIRRVSVEVCAIIIAAPSLDNRKFSFRVYLHVYWYLCTCLFTLVDLFYYYYYY